MLKVHFTPGTRAGRVVWLLEELDLDYDVNIMHDIHIIICLLYTSPSPRDYAASRMPSSA